MSISSIPPLSETAEHYRSSLVTIDDVGNGNLFKGRIYLEGASERFEGIELERACFSLYSDDKFLCSLVQNAVGNNNDLTYSCTFANGAVVILPVPVAGQEPFQYFFDTSFASVFCLNPEDVKSKSDKMYCLSLDYTGAVTLSNTALRKEICWPLAYELQVAQRSGKIDEHSHQTIAGLDGSIEAEIDNFEIFMDTNRQLGICKGYTVNGDNIGCDVERGMAVLADGLGGHGNDHLASSFAVRKILESKRHLGQAISSASEQLQGAFNYYLKEDKFRVNVNRPSQMGDTTIIAIEIVESVIHLVNIGDGRWFHIRDGKILKQNWRKGSMRGVLIDTGVLTERDGYELQKTDKSLGTVVVSTLSNYEVHDQCYGSEIASREMESGDFFVAFTDGFDAITEAEILYALKDDQDLMVASEILKRTAIRKNIQRYYDQPLSDGTIVKDVPSPCDSGSLMIVRKP